MMTDDRAAEPSAEAIEARKAALQPWYDAPIDWEGEEVGLETAIDRALDAFAAQAVHSERAKTRDAVAERDALRAAYGNACRERDEAQAEVARLTARRGASVLSRVWRALLALAKA